MKETTQFSTLNESSLHHSLKALYQDLYQGQCEVECDGHIYDIVTKNRNVIEIQTKNLAKLLPKILDTIEKGRKVKLVHPIPLTKTILLCDKGEKIISKRKSPIKGNVYDIFRELTGLYPVLLDKNFSLEIVEINMTEKRLRTTSPVQSKNGRRRFKKDWNKSDKILDEILSTRRFCKKEDYLALLPKSLSKEFCAKDLGTALKEERLAPARIYNNPHLIIWVLNKMEIIEFTEKRGRTNFYRVK